MGIASASNGEGSLAGLSPAIIEAARSLQSIYPALPRAREVESHLQDGQQADQRGYFTPDEDERLREIFSRYLGLRAALHDTINTLRLRLKDGTIPESQYLPAFTTGFTAACLLMRAGRFIVDTVADSSVARAKLDEAEPRYGIPPKQFTTIFRAISRPRTLVRYYQALAYAQSHREQINALRSCPELAPVLDIFEAEEPYIESRRRYYTNNILQYRLHATQRASRAGIKRIMFALFKLSGSAIAEMRNPFHRKRVTRRIQRKVSGMLQPGDVIITRHDDAMSNLFLPGFWPHGALYMGTEDQRQNMNLRLDAQREAKCLDPFCVLEARKDGVLFRPLQDTLQVDSFTILRPRLEAKQIAEALGRAATHEGKLYDFEFDFSRADRLVCTEVTYRAYHHPDLFQFALKSRSGRMCLSAEDLLDCAFEPEIFDVVGVYGVNGNRLVTGPEAKETLRKSYRS